MLGELTCVGGSLKGKIFQFPIDAAPTLGRTHAADLYVPDPSISRRQCRFEAGGDNRIVLVDLDSGNGTHVNGRPANGQLLADGDRIVCGNIEFVFRYITGEFSPAPARLRTVSHATLSKHVATDLMDALREQFTPGKTLFGISPSDKGQPKQGGRAGLNAVCGLAEKLRRLRTPDEVMSASIEVSLVLTNINRAAVVLRDTATGELRIAHYRDNAIGESEDFKISLTVVQDVIANNESLLVRDASLDDRFKHGDSIIGGGIHSILCVPMGDERQAFGAIYADTTAFSRILTEDQLFLLSAIAHQTGVALERAWLVDDLQKLFVGAIHSMVRSLEAKDAYTRGHTGRVMLLALQLADRIGVGQEERDALELGGLMHDIGKIGIRDDILSKPGRLTQEEYELVKEHPGIGAEILSGMPNLDRLVSLSAVIEAVRGHHERLDGKGYPDALAGDDVPRSARLLAIADVWDALTTTRSYRKAMSRDEAWKIMEDGSGAQFDPYLLMEFKKLVDSGATEDLSLVPTCFGLGDLSSEAPVPVYVDTLSLHRQRRSE